MIISDAEKAFDKNLTPLHDKNPRKTRDTKDTFKHNKCNLQETYTQHRPKLRETQRISSNTQEKDKGIHSLSIYLLHST